MFFNKCDPKVKDLLNTSRVLKNPLIKGFLENEENFRLFQKAVLSPTKENKTKVEEKFSSYYEKVRMVAYYHRLIKQYAIDFDKRLRKARDKYSLTLETPLESGNEEAETLLSLIPDEKVNENIIYEKTLKEAISDEKLYNALKSLTETQYRILELIYARGLTTKEIADIIKSTPQNVSNIHRKAIKKLRKIMVGENYEYKKQ
ncbi:sigma-70 family RNA polymerase sigma factor [Weizmannia sp. CD-2023]|uniref:sigma-70 family RNA polymerase sigma factor n=1 Tax=Heyndrickxia TaxID=2837504 RepID=UPI00054EDE31|nr:MULTISPECIES: sigma-70 family RNA polymerase sigma factor [Heyndrickxia]QWU06598.1 sigma-70 family RNA polymerase sigma factor [Heyndrickxia coagulans]KGT37546.1 hypothetical protein P421_14780 [Heyndrickxia coagulans P38]MED4320064.1 sigma-70 family RNA polymerase sigma factor [Weizmannia sp. CD-2023]MED4839170.1 sigma-70 family RNA polymerase sigma factor [Weizmannia sp. CD-2023]MED4901062.1 sigma-70 family RNA polymerase sigma factor [Weizmannia sp. CD-2023]